MVLDLLFKLVLTPSWFITEKVIIKILTHIHFIFI